MKLTEKQMEGLLIAIKRYAEGKKYTVISGYAGVGKSFLTKHIIKALNVSESDVSYCAPTGKAALVLEKMGNPNVETIHRLLYKWIPKEDGSFVKVRKDHLSKIVICDEVSMVPKEFIEELLTHRESYIIFIGDPFQIPPIYKDQDNHLLDKPHIFLDEVMRQSLDSTIIKLSMDLREKKRPEFVSTNDVQVLPNHRLVTGMYLWADQIICSTNKTRESINSHVISLLGYEDRTPKENMKIIALKNYWNIFSLNKGQPLVNGTICYLKNIRSVNNYTLTFAGVHKADLIQADLYTEDNDFYQDVILDPVELETGFSQFSPEEIVQMNKFYTSLYAKKRRYKNLTPVSVNYGYAITGHKSQGSQWDKVLVIEESFPTKTEEHYRWLYTACTRPSEKLVLITKD